MDKISVLGACLRFKSSLIIMGDRPLSGVFFLGFFGIFLGVASPLSAWTEDGEASPAFSSTPSLSCAFCLSTSSVSFWSSAGGAALFSTPLWPFWSLSGNFLLFFSSFWAWGMHAGRFCQAKLVDLLAGWLSMALTLPCPDLLKPFSFLVPFLFPFLFPFLCLSWEGHHHLLHLYISHQGLHPLPPQDLLWLGQPSSWALGPAFQAVHICTDRYRRYVLNILYII